MVELNQMTTQTPEALLQQDFCLTELFSFTLPTRQCCSDCTILSGCSLLTAPCPPRLSLPPCSAVGPISGGCGWRPAAGGPLNGLSHYESVGGCRLVGVERRGLRL